MTQPEAKSEMVRRSPRLEAEPTLSNPDLEHFILWTDDQETLSSRSTGSILNTGSSTPHSVRQ